MRSILIQKIDCNFLLDNVKEVKTLVDPCELRIKHNERVWKDLRHPFLFIPNHLRDIILIGTASETEKAESKLVAFLKEKRERDGFLINQQLSLLMPLCLKDNFESLKSRVRHRYPMVQIFHYLPTFPRKHLTVSLIGPWSEIVEAQKLLEDLSRGCVFDQYQSYEHF